MKNRETYDSLMEFEKDFVPEFNAYQELLSSSSNKSEEYQAEINRYKLYFDGLPINEKWKMLKENFHWLVEAYENNNMELFESLLKDFEDEEKLNLLQQKFIRYGKEVNFFDYKENKEIFNKFLDICKNSFLTFKKKEKTEWLYKNTEFLREVVTTNNLNLLNAMFKDVDKLEKFGILRLAKSIANAKNDKAIDVLFSGLDRNQARILLKECEVKNLLAEKLSETNILQLPKYFDLLESEERKNLLRKNKNPADKELALQLLELEKRPKLRKMLAAYKIDGDIQQSLLNKTGNFLAKITPERKTDLQLFEEMKNSQPILIAATKIEEQNDEKLIRQRPKLQKLLENNKKVLNIKNRIGSLLAEFVPGRESDMQAFIRIKSKRNKHKEL